MEVISAFFTELIGAPEAQDGIVTAGLNANAPMHPASQGLNLKTSGLDIGQRGLRLLRSPFSATLSKVQT